LAAELQIVGADFVAGFLKLATNFGGFQGGVLRLPAAEMDLKNVGETPTLLEGTQNEI
jgi:hypothetical protein